MDKKELVNRQKWVGVRRCVIGREGAVFSPVKNIEARRAIKENVELTEILNNADWAYKVINDRDGVPRYTMTNQHIFQLLGYEPEEVIGMSIYDFMVPEIREKVKEDYEKAVKKGLPFENYINANIHRITGQIVHLETSARPVFDEYGNVIGFVGVDRNVTKRVEAERQLLERSNTDYLTGVYNRRFLVDTAEIMLNQRRGGPITVFEIDVDKFKTVNDTYGHVVGDKILILIAQIIGQALRVGDVLGRMGGDEFVALLDGIGVKDAKTIAERIEKAVEEEIQIEGRRLKVSITIGRLTIEDRKGKTWDALYKRVDKDLIRRKDKKRVGR